MAYSRNEKKLKEYLFKKDDTNRPDKKNTGHSGGTSNDSNLRGR
jgi:hypothetical protein